MEIQQLMEEWEHKKQLNKVISLNRSTLLIEWLQGKMSKIEDFIKDFCKKYLNPELSSHTWELWDTYNIGELDEETQLSVDYYVELGRKKERLTSQWIAFDPKTIGRWAPQQIKIVFDNSPTS